MLQRAVAKRLTHGDVERSGCACGVVTEPSAAYDTRDRMPFSHSAVLRTLDR
jgi:hypothetical protein